MEKSSREFPAGKKELAALMNISSFLYRPGKLVIAAPSRAIIAAVYAVILLPTLLFATLSLTYTLVIALQCVIAHLIVKGLLGAKQAESNRAQLAAIVEFSDDAILSMTLDGKIVTWNRGAEKFYGYSASDMVGRPFTALVDSVRSVELERLLAKASRGEAVIRHETIGVRKDASTLNITLSLSPIRDASETVIGASAISRDITERKRLETELQAKSDTLEEQYLTVREANRLKSEFLANMSHELRTPLNGIIGIAQLMRDGKIGAVSTEHEEYLEDILASGRHLLELINDVLDLARVESGKIQFNPAPAELSPMVHQVCQILQSLIAGRRQSIDLKVSADVEHVVVDSARFKQILYNYLSNAIKFTPDGGTISIRAIAEDSEFFRIEVEDNGIGIPPERIGELFVEFKQLEPGLSKRHQGTGLGLALTKKFIEAQGGSVGVRSVVGQGSVFFAVLPRSAPSVVQRARRETVPAAGALEGPRILVVEGNEKDLEWLTRTLSTAGYLVDAAASGAEAIAKAQHTPYAAVLLDLILPDTLGWDVLHQIRQATTNENTPVIVATVVSEKAAAKSFALQDYLIKPYSAAALLTSLRRAGVIGNGGGKKILVVDADPQMLQLAAAALESSGYQTSCHSNAPRALAAAANIEISAVVFDLLNGDEMEGHDFLERLRKLASCKNTPVIIWTAKNLTTEERQKLNGSADSITSKRQGGIDAVLRELRYHSERP